MHQKGNIAVLGLPSVIAVLFLYIYAPIYLTGDPEQFGIYKPNYQWLLVHVIAGTVALLSGPTQLWLGLNRRTAILHRVLGVLYVMAVSAGAASAFRLAFHTSFGWVFGLGFASMASAWVITTAWATIAICRRRAEQHREWVIRSYVVTFAFVTFRLLESVFETARVGTLVERVTAASWLAWTVPLLITESILQGRKIFEEPAVAAPPRDGSAYDAVTPAKPFDLQRTGSLYQRRPSSF